MGEKALKLRERKDPIRTHDFTPMSFKLKARIDRVKRACDERGLEPFNAAKREMLERLTSEYESLLELPPL